jgi:hypothetical protein
MVKTPLPPENYLERFAFLKRIQPVTTGTSVQATPETTTKYGFTTGTSGKFSGNTALIT